MIDSKWMALAMIACVATLSSPLSAQSRSLSVEGRVGATVPLGDLSDLGAESGLMVEGELIYTPSLNLSVFGGIGLHAFNCDDDECEEFSSRGVHGGVKYLFAQSGRAMPWVRGGLMLHEAESGDADTGMALGFEAGGGIDFALGPHLTLTPALRFHAYDAEFASSSVGMSWLSFGLGAHYHF